MATEKRFVDLSVEEREEVLDKAWREDGEWVDLVEKRYVVDEALGGDVEQYPEHEKLKRVKDQSQTIGEFLDWLQNEDRITLCRVHKIYDEPFSIDEYVPNQENIESILARYFGIDLDKIENEKDKMLEVIRTKD